MLTHCGEARNNHFTSSYTSFELQSRRSRCYKCKHVALNSACTARAHLLGRDAESPELALIASAASGLELKGSMSTKRRDDEEGKGGACVEHTQRARVRVCHESISSLATSSVAAFERRPGPAGYPRTGVFYQPRFEAQKHLDVGRTKDEENVQRRQTEVRTPRHGICIHLCGKWGHFGVPSGQGEQEEGFVWEPFRAFPRNSRQEEQKGERHTPSVSSLEGQNSRSEASRLQDKENNDREDNEGNTREQYV
ncbi:hypothetical protein ISCGN_001555 [Ixodes scapularis]